jgi:glutamate 5-kinase
MKTFLFVVLAAFSTLAVAGDIWNKEEKWNMKAATAMTVTVIPVDNVQASCEKESRRRGNGGFNSAVQACTFWAGNECTIIIAKKETHHTLGHEFYHCRAGGFH